MKKKPTSSGYHVYDKVIEIVKSAGPGERHMVAGYSQILYPPFDSWYEFSHRLKYEEEGSLYGVLYQEDDGCWYVYTKATPQDT